MAPEKIAFIFNTSTPISSELNKKCIDSINAILNNEKQSCAQKIEVKELNYEISSYIDPTKITDIPERKVIREGDPRWHSAMFRKYPIHSIHTNIRVLNKKYQ